MRGINRTVARFKESIFATITREAQAGGAVNLGQGFPDFDGPRWVIELARAALDRRDQGVHQYAPSIGVAPLRQVLSREYRTRYGLDYDANAEVTVMTGATEAIFATALALLDPGDEAVVMEPFYDSYVASIELAGARPVPVTLHAPGFTLDEAELRRAFGPRTKLLFLNTPNNPTGKVFGRDELELVARVAREHDCFVVSDEVYEHLLYDGAEHVPLAALPGMRERTVTVSSTGKTFGLTGWKLGWACAPAPLSHALRMVRQFTTFCVNHPLQLAVAEALGRLDEYLPGFRRDYAERRDLFVAGARAAGFEPIVPRGTYFTMVPIPEPGLSDVEYCRKLILERKVAAIPPSPFYLASDEGTRYVRFCFAKKLETLRAALENLRR